MGDISKNPPSDGVFERLMLMFEALRSPFEGQEQFKVTLVLLITSLYIFGEE